MRQPKRHFIHHARAAVYLDANIAELKSCKSGCSTDTAYECIHRFGQKVYVISQQKRIAFTRLSDLQVILDFLHIILSRWKNGATGVWGRKYYILTSDRRFLQSAEHAFRRERNMRSLPLKFQAHGVTYVSPGYPWEIFIEVCTLSRTAKDSQDNLRDAIAFTRSHIAP